METVPVLAVPILVRVVAIHLTSFRPTFPVRVPRAPAPSTGRALGARQGGPAIATDATVPGAAPDLAP